MTTKKTPAKKTYKSDRVAKSPAGRPKNKFDLDQIERAASIGCTEEEIAVLVGISYRNFKEHRSKPNSGILDAIETGRRRGQVSLRRLQWKNAEDGSVPMQIWLGKQLLDQRDRPADDVLTVNTGDFVITLSED